MSSATPRSAWETLGMGLRAHFKVHFAVCGDNGFQLACRLVERIALAELRVIFTASGSLSLAPEHHGRRIDVSAIRCRETSMFNRDLEVSVIARAGICSGGQQASPPPGSRVHHRDAG